MPNNLFRDNTSSNQKTLFPENTNKIFKQGGVSISTKYIKQELDKIQMEKKKITPTRPVLTGVTSASSSSSST